MKLKHIKLAMLGAVGITGNAAAFDLGDVSFTPRVGIGIQKYKLQFDAYHSDGTKRPGAYFKVDEYVPTFILGGTVSMDRLYLDAYWSQTDTSGETYSTDGPFHPATEPSASIKYNNLFKADHQDVAVSLGYAFENMLDGLTIFGGYKYGKTNATGKYTEVTIKPGDDLESGHGTEKTKFEAQGPFLGAGYGLHLGPGILSLTGAWLKGDIRDEQNDKLEYTSKPDATGFALSLKWKAPITDQVSYSLSLDSYKYDYDKKTTSNGVLMKATEESVGVRAALSYEF